MADRLLRSFLFRVKLLQSATVPAGSTLTFPPEPDFSGTPLGDGAFQECSGLEVEMDVQDYLEGGLNDGVIRRVGRAKYSPLVLKRGMFHSEEGVLNTELWNWIQSMVSGQRPVTRYDGLVEVMSEGENVVATWSFIRGLPTKVRGPELNGKTGDIAIEELHIAHEGLRLES
jgi:phage tail-like protein